MKTPQKMVVLIALFILGLTLLYVPFTWENADATVSGTRPIWELENGGAVDYRFMGSVWFGVILTAAVFYFMFSSASKSEKAIIAAVSLLVVATIIVFVEKSRLVPRYSLERSMNKDSRKVNFKYSLIFESEVHQLNSTSELSPTEIIQMSKEAGKLAYKMHPDGCISTLWLEFESQFFPNTRAKITGPSHVAYERSQKELNRLMNPTFAAIGSVLPWFGVFTLILGAVYRFSNRTKQTETRI